MFFLVVVFSLLMFLSVCSVSPSVSLSISVPCPLSNSRLKSFLPFLPFSCFARNAVAPHAFCLFPLSPSLPYSLSYLSVCICGQKPLRHFVGSSSSGPQWAFQQQVKSKSRGKQQQKIQVRFDAHFGQHSSAYNYKP